MQIMLPLALQSFELPRIWLSECLEHRGGICDRTRPTVPMKRSYLRKLVDVALRRVVIALESRSYVTLTYAWGSLQPAFVERLPVDADEFDLPRQIPKTISDAMFVAIEMNQRYLWIYTLCVPQVECQENRTRFDIWM